MPACLIAYGTGTVPSESVTAAAKQSVGERLTP